jgi:pimeloyl-ACP methyl ester carboxylesterase
MLRHTREIAVSYSLPTSGSVNVNGIRLHYLDWGGQGPALVFLAGMGCSAFIFSRLAPRFTPIFRVLALDRRGHGDSDFPDTGYDPDTLAEDLRCFLDALGIHRTHLVGHSMGYLELTRFAVLHPDRTLKLVFLDAAYDGSLPYYQEAYAKNPLGTMMPAWPEEDPPTVEEYITTFKRLYPALAVIWNEAMEEQIRHTIACGPHGGVKDKMSDTISAAIAAVFASYSPEYSRIQAPVLSFFSIRDGSDYLSPEYMSSDQEAQVLNFFQNVLGPCQRRQIEDFRRQLPQATIVELPAGHHYCFIRHEELVAQAMTAFLQG